jgi:hypothetical protein
MKNLMKIVLVLLLFAMNTNVFSQDYIFWGDYVNGNVYRSDLNGENITIIATGQSMVRTVTVDNENFRVFWAYGTNGVKSANFDGSDVVQILNYGVSIGRIEFDYLNNRIYFSENFLGTIKSCKMDGTDIQLLVSETGFIQGLGVESGRQYIFWGDQDSGEIYRANTDGTGIITVLETSTSLYDLELDVKLMKIYFSDRTEDVIKVVDYDGDNLQTLVFSNGVMGSMSTDFEREKLYWIERENGLIRVANLDGTEITDIIFDAGSQFGGQDISQNYVIAENQKLQISKKEVCIYPNPAKEIIYTDLSEDSELSFYSNIGQLILKASARVGEPVCISGLKSGVYSVKIENLSGIKTSKLVIP